MKYKILLAVVALAIVGVMLGIRYNQLKPDNTPQEELIADIPVVLYTQDCMPKTLVDIGVSTKWFDHSNIEDEKICSKKELETIKKYYDKEEWKTDPNNGTEKFCAE